MTFEFLGTAPTNVLGIGRVLNPGDMITEEVECNYINSLPDTAVKRLFKKVEFPTYTTPKKKMED